MNTAAARDPNMIQNVSGISLAARVVWTLTNVPTTAVATLHDFTHRRPNRFLRTTISSRSISGWSTTLLIGATATSLSDTGTRDLIRLTTLAVTTVFICYKSLFSVATLLARSTTGLTSAAFAFAEIRIIRVVEIWIPWFTATAVTTPVGTAIPALLAVTTRPSGAAVGL